MVCFSKFYAPKHPLPPPHPAASASESLQDCSQLKTATSPKVTPPPIPKGSPHPVTVGCRDIKTGTCCLRVQSFKALPSPDLLWDQLSSLLWMHHSSTLPNLTSSSPSSLKTCQVLSGPDLIQLALGLTQGSRVKNGILDPCWAAGNEDTITSDRWDNFKLSLVVTLRKGMLWAWGLRGAVVGFWEAE